MRDAKTDCLAETEAPPFAKIINLSRVAEGVLPISRYKLWFTIFFITVPFQIQDYAWLKCGDLLRNLTLSSKQYIYRDDLRSLFEVSLKSLFIGSDDLRKQVVFKR